MSSNRTKPDHVRQSQAPDRHHGDARQVCLIASPGQRNDIAFAHELVDGFQVGATIADKGYVFMPTPCATGSLKREPRTVIPPKRNRKLQRPYDTNLYKERNLIERFFNKLKQFRRVATRYDTGGRARGYHRRRRHESTGKGDCWRARGRTDGCP